MRWRRNNRLIPRHPPDHHVDKTADARPHGEEKEDDRQMLNNHRIFITSRTASSADNSVTSNSCVRVASQIGSRAANNCLISSTFPPSGVNAGRVLAVS